MSTPSEFLDDLERRAKGQQTVKMTGKEVERLHLLRGEVVLFTRAPVEFKVDVLQTYIASARTEVAAAVAAKLLGE